MNPVRTLAPDLVANDYHAYWVYLAGPLLGACIAVAAAFILRGYGGGRTGSAAAQGALLTETARPEQA
jgi:aquaporin Z